MSPQTQYLIMVQKLLRDQKLAIVQADNEASSSKNIAPLVT